MGRLWKIIWMRRKRLHFFGALASIIMCGLAGTLLFEYHIPYGPYHGYLKLGVVILGVLVVSLEKGRCLCEIYRTL